MRERYRDGVQYLQPLGSNYLIALAYQEIKKSANVDLSRIYSFMAASISDIETPLRSILSQASSRNDANADIILRNKNGVHAAARKNAATSEGRNVFDEAANAAPPLRICPREPKSEGRETNLFCDCSP